MTLELKNVAKRVGAETHIYETSIKLADTGFNILLGTTLAGKTTLMQLMAGLERPTSGEVWFDGRNVTGVPVQKRNVSMVHQQFINYPNMSVFENIASPLRVARLERGEIENRVESVADLLKLTPMLKRRPSELSGGQQQRTALARALVKDADLILLDEPLANLDFKLREELRDELPKLFAGRRRGTSRGARCTVVYATTEPSEALLLGGRTAALHEGRITQFGPTLDVYRSPGDLVTARVFSDPPINIATVDKRNGRIYLNETVDWPAEGRHGKLPDGRYMMGIRPHHVTPAIEGNGAENDRTQLSGRVQITELSGSESVIHFTHQGLRWVSQSQGIHDMEIGKTTAFDIAVAHCLYFDENAELIAS